MKYFLLISLLIAGNCFGGLLLKTPWTFAGAKEFYNARTYFKGLNLSDPTLPSRVLYHYLDQNRQGKELKLVQVHIKKFSNSKINRYVNNPHYMVKYNGVFLCPYLDIVTQKLPGNIKVVMALRQDYAGELIAGLTKEVGK